MRRQHSPGFSWSHLSLKVAVIVTSIEVIVAVVVESSGLARISVSPIQRENFFPGGGGSAVTLIPKVSAA